MAGHGYIPPVDVLLVADMCVDLILRGNVRPQFRQVEQVVDDYTLELGGSANIFASQMVKLGGRVGVIGKLGEDYFGELALRRLTELGVDTSRVQRCRGLRTGLGVALVESEDRAILTFLGTIDAVSADDLPARLEQACRHWHVASYFLLKRLRPFWPEWFRRCREAGVTTSLDTNWDPEERWDGVLDLLPWVDVFLPNEAEACALAGAADVMEAARLFGGYCPTVVIKRGDKGSLAIREGEITTYCPQPVDRTSLVDSVGAGDNFDAGFLSAWIRGREMQQCLDLAHRCAASSLLCAGGIAGQLRGE